MAFPIFLYLNYHLSIHGFFTFTCGINFTLTTNVLDVTICLVFFFCKKTTTLLEFNVKSKELECKNFTVVFSSCFLLQTVMFLNKAGKRKETSQPAITCSKLTIETLGQGVKYVQI